MDFHGSAILFLHRGKIGFSAQVEMAMPGDSLSISLAPGRAQGRKLCCVSNIVQPATASGSSSRTSKKSLPGQSQNIIQWFSQLLSGYIVVISGDNSSKYG